MRRDLITRTISGTKATVEVLDKVTKTVIEKDVILNATFNGKDAESKLAKAIAKALNEETELFVSVISTEAINKLYGITPADFMAHAIELDPKTRDEVKAEETPVTE